MRVDVLSIPDVTQAASAPVFSAGGGPQTPSFSDALAGAASALKMPLTSKLSTSARDPSTPVSPNHSSQQAPAPLTILSGQKAASASRAGKAIASSPSTSSAPTAISRNTEAAALSMDAQSADPSSVDSAMNFAVNFAAAVTSSLLAEAGAEEVMSAASKAGAMPAGERSLNLSTANDRTKPAMKAGIQPAGPGLPAGGDPSFTSAATAIATSPPTLAAAPTATPAPAADPVFTGFAAPAPQFDLANPTVKIALPAPQPIAAAADTVPDSSPDFSRATESALPAAAPQPSPAMTSIAIPAAPVRTTAPTWTATTLPAVSSPPASAAQLSPPILAPPSFSSTKLVPITGSLADSAGTDSPANSLEGAVRSVANSAIADGSKTGTFSEPNSAISRPSAGLAGTLFFDPPRSSNDVAPAVTMSAPLPAKIFSLPYRPSANEPNVIAPALGSPGSQVTSAKLAQPDPVRVGAVKNENDGTVSAAIASAVADDVVASGVAIANRENEGISAAISTEFGNDAHASAALAGIMFTSDVRPEGEPESPASPAPPSSPLPPSPKMTDAPFPAPAASQLTSTFPSPSAAVITTPLVAVAPASRADVKLNAAEGPNSILSPLGGLASQAASPDLTVRPPFPSELTAIKPSAPRSESEPSTASIPESSPAPLHDLPAASIHESSAASLRESPALLQERDLTASISTTAAAGPQSGTSEPTEEAPTAVPIPSPSYLADPPATTVTQSTAMNSPPDASVPASTAAQARDAASSAAKNGPSNSADAAPSTPSPGAQKASLTPIAAAADSAGPGWPAPASAGLPSAAVSAHAASSVPIAPSAPAVSAPTAALPDKPGTSAQLPPAHQMLDSTPPTNDPASAPPPAHLSADAAALQMHLGIRTSAFGNVEIHTVVEQSQVGVAIHGDRDLARWFSSEVGGLEAGLKSQHLNLNGVDFSSNRSGVQTASSFQQGQPRQNFSQTWGSHAAALPSEAEAVASEPETEPVPAALIAGPSETRVSILA